MGSILQQIMEDLAQIDPDKVEPPKDKPNVPGKKTIGVLPKELIQLFGLEALYEKRGEQLMAEHEARIKAIDAEDSRIRAKALVIEYLSALRLARDYQEIATKLFRAGVIKTFPEVSEGEVILTESGFKVSICSILQMAQAEGLANAKAFLEQVERAIQSEKEGAKPEETDEAADERAREPRGFLAAIARIITG